MWCLDLKQDLSIPGDQEGGLEEAAELDSGGCYFPVVRIRPCSYNNNEVAICKQNIQQDPA
ncbi:MAG: hypothetical protein CME21_04875 [Gemmatimonadetes bacterium]|nr:hypothetical protein [Gemmatimonadota bacterium]HCK12094.1 hypothetical protein [Candidatus Latescibacterota bacterium]